MAIFKTNKEVSNVFMLNGVPSFSEFYNLGIYPWKLMYRGYLADFHTISAPTINNPSAKRKMNTMRMAKALCSEMANLVWAEGSKVIVNQKGWNKEEEDPLQAYIDSVLDKNYFDSKMRQSIEESLALGGSTIRTYAKEKAVGIDGEGNPIVDYEVGLSYGRADMFVPLSWDNKRITEAVFIEKTAKNGWYWTRLEFHKWNGVEYVVSNEYYKTQNAPIGNTSQDILGIRSPMSEIWANLPESVPFYNLQLGLFTYFRTCMANNLDDNSPLGISFYANAIDTIKALDVAFDSFIMEMKLGKKRIIVPATAVRKVRDSKGFEYRYFDANDEVYEALNIDSTESLQIKDNSVELRIDEHVKAINALLNILSVQVGLSEGSLSFDSARGMKTATEVISENSKTFRTVKLMQKPIQKSVQDLIASIIDVSCAYDITFEHNGATYNVYDLVKNGYDVTVSFDDSIIQDRSADLAEGLTLVQNGLISKKTYLTNYLGYTAEMADAELELMKGENSSNRTINVDWSGVE